MGRPKKKSCKVPVNSVKTRNIGKSPPDVHSVISSSESETEEIDRGLKAVRTVRDRQERNRRLDACDVLQRKVDEQCRALINSTHQVRAAISDPANTTLCRITREMNNVINLVPSIHRATSMLHRVKYKSEETPYTLYDMGQDGRYRRVSVDGETDSEQEDYRHVDKNRDHVKAKRRHNDIVVEYRRGEELTEYADKEADRVRRLEKEKDEEVRKARTTGKVPRGRPRKKPKPAPTLIGFHEIYLNENDQEEVDKED